MRITNKIMQNNTLYNINQNKVVQDKLNKQITTRKKVTKPSDDPVVAIRALRLRSNLNEITQYYEKNIPDAKNWMDVTETAVATTADIVTTMIDQFRKGAKGSMTTSDKSTILESLKQLREEVYATGDSDYAGRTIFTGYRTDMKLSFQKPETTKFEITEQLTNNAVSTITYIDTGEVGQLNEVNSHGAGLAASPLTKTNETDVQSYDIHRIRLAYDTLDGTMPVLTQTIAYDLDNNPITQPIIPAASITDWASVSGTSNSPYDYISGLSAAGTVGALFVPETGELLLSDAAYDAIMQLDPEREICVTYEKSEWEKGDLRPEHYFCCTKKDPINPINDITYNSEYLTEYGRDAKQIIEYDVGFNMSLEVNITADSVYKHGIGREVDEMINLLSSVQNMDTVVDKLSGLLKDNSLPDSERAELSNKLDAAKKAQTYLSNTLQVRFEKGITQMQGYLDDVNLAYTTTGNRGLRLDLIENRLGNQQSSFRILQSENEDADLAELAVELSSAELTYNAALAATGKLLSTTLLNYL